MWSMRYHLSRVIGCGVRRFIAAMLIACILAQCLAPTMASAAIATASTIRFTQISAGEFNSCGLTTIGSILCWGDNSDGQSSVPPPPDGSTYTEVSAGYRHTCALTTQQNVVCWGANDAGQASPPGSVQSVAVQVSAGDDFTCALTTDGTITCWGLDDNQQTSAPAPPPGATFTQVSAGGVIACAVATNLD